MSSIKVLITAGGTRESIDEVRVLTNISTGKLGAMIAEEFSNRSSFDIYYMAPNTAVRPSTKHTYIEVNNVESVYDKMNELVPQMDVVIHSMAVSDFGFKPAHTKLKSNDPQAFIDSLRDRIYQTPKILSHIKEWNPDCFLVSFKFEVGLSRDDLIDIATKSGEAAKSDIVIANDKATMKFKNKHCAIGICKDSNFQLGDKKEISEFIFEKTYSKLNGRTY